MTNELESPIIGLSPDFVTQTALPITITPEVSRIKIGGATTKRTMETDKRTIYCGEGPMAGDMLFSGFSEHVLIWTSGEIAVMIATSDLSEIRPLSDLTIRIENLPERYTPGDIFYQPDSVSLIHVGRSDDEELQEIKKRAQVGTIIPIFPDSLNELDRFKYEHWEVGYDGKKATLLIFPCSGDEYLSYHIDNNHAEKNGLSSEIRRRLDTYEIYQQYRLGGGVIGWQFMGDAAMLSKEEMRIKYSRDSEIYIGDPQERLEYIVGKTGIKLTEEQKNLFLNLRWIPIEIPQVIYDIGPSQRMAKPPAREEFVHPYTLDEIGILSQVLKFTHDEDREEMLARYCSEGTERYITVERLL